MSHPSRLPAILQAVMPVSYTHLDVYKRQLKSSTTGPGVTATSAASVRRPLNRPRREDRKCLLLWGQSINDTEVSVKPVAIQNPTKSEVLGMRLLLRKHVNETSGSVFMWERLSLPE